MDNPFENQGDMYRVLINDEGQYSLWPASARVPAGWRAEYGPDHRQQCLDYIEIHWTDMRPKSLVAAMAEMKRS